MIFTVALQKYFQVCLSESRGPSLIFIDYIVMRVPSIEFQFLWFIIFAPTKPWWLVNYSCGSHSRIERLSSEPHIHTQILLPSLLPYRRVNFRLCWTLRSKIRVPMLCLNVSKWPGSHSVFAHHDLHAFHLINYYFAICHLQWDSRTRAESWCSIKIFPWSILRKRCCSKKVIIIRGDYTDFRKSGRWTVGKHPLIRYRNYGLLSIGWEHTIGNYSLWLTYYGTSNWRQSTGFVTPLIVGSLLRMLDHQSSRVSWTRVFMNSDLFSSKGRENPFRMG